MHDALLVLLGAGGTSLGVMLGMAVQSMRRPKPGLPPHRQMICSCHHPRGAHLDDGKCQASEIVDLNDEEEWAQCVCTKYYGPKLVEEWVPGNMPAIGGGE